MSNEMEIKVTTYEEDRLNYFERLMRESQYRYNRLFKRFKNAPIMSAEAQRLSDAGREVQFHGDVVEMLEKGYRKQSDLTPCHVCKFNPPSSGDGKPCSICPAQGKGGE